MQLRALVLASFAAAVSGTAVTKKSSLDINQKVYIDNAPVLGDGAGEAALNQCQNFAKAPGTVKVCGTGIKLTAFMRGRCEKYYEHQKEIGSCDKGAASSTCESWSPSDDPRFEHYQSYKIEQC